MKKKLIFKEELLSGRSSETGYNECYSCAGVLCILETPWRRNPIRFNW